MISFPCPHCAKTLRVKDELAGKKGKCPTCVKPITVPAVSGNLAGALSELAKRSPAPQTDSQKQPTLPQLRSEAKALTLPPNGTVGAALPADSAGSETIDSAPNRGAGIFPPELTDFLSSPQAPDEIGRLGHYRILKVLGHGGMGVVFQAEEPSLKRKIAIKAMLPILAVSETAKQRFLREAQSAAAVEHDNIVPIYFVGEDRGVPFLAMPFLKGEPLDERLSREKILSVAEVLRVGREAAKGLGAAHAAGLVHRDIKPANLWLESSLTEPGAAATGTATGGRVKILDFGLARATADNAQLTQQGAIVGTPAYMAPEQAGGGAVDARCDLFSLGCVLYRACTGETPFKGSDTISTLVSVAMHNPAPPVDLRPELPGELSDLVMQMLAKKPENRPVSANEVVRALHAIETTLGQQSSKPLTKKKVGSTMTPPLLSSGRSPQPTKTNVAVTRRVRRPLWFAAGIAVVALLLATAGIYLASRERYRPEVPAQTPSAEAFGLPEKLPATFTNRLGMEFVLIPKGKSWLGGGGGNPGDKEVEIKEDFYLGKYEVTQEEWEKVTGLTPSYFSRTGLGREAVKNIPDAELKSFPVEMVSWDDAQAFLTRLNAREKEAGWVYRLPKEAEWEYACRGGPLANRLDSTFDFYFDKPTNEFLAEQAHIATEKDPALPRLRKLKVGSYKPNRLGLFDMHGNVTEWCDDSVTAADGTARRMIVGGSWYDVSINCRAAFRNTDPPSTRYFSVGLRLARVPTGNEVVVVPPKPLEPVQPMGALPAK